jgi:AcrR family transcriptional regulator
MIFDDADTPPRRRGRPALPAEHHRKRLLEGALEVLARGPGTPLRIADVTAAAQMSTKSFYEHFASKDELVLAIFDHSAQQFLAQTRRVLDADLPPEDTARTILRSFLSLFPATVLHFETAYPRQLAKLRAMRRAAVEAATDLAFEHLARLHARGEVQAAPNRVVVEFAMTGALDLAMRYFVEGRIQDVLDHEADFTRAVIRALDLPVKPALAARPAAAHAIRVAKG